MAFVSASAGVEVVLKERMNDDVFRAVREREVELGLGYTLRPDKELQWVPLGTDRILAILPPSHALAGSASITWRQLENQSMITLGTGSTVRALLSSNLRLQSSFEVEYVATAVALVREGLGITTLPSTVISGLNMDGLVTVPIAGSMARRNLGVAYRKDAQLSKIAQAFLEQLQRIADARGAGQA